MYGKIRWDVEYPEQDNQYVQFLDTEILIHHNDDKSSRDYRKPISKGIIITGHTT